MPKIELSGTMRLPEGSDENESNAFSERLTRRIEMQFPTVPVS